MKAAIGLGSSLGDRIGQLERAVLAFHHRPGVQVQRVSAWVRTPPLRGGAARGHFVNGVILVDTTLAPMALLDACVDLERRAGRRRARRWGDRTLDVDVLLVEGQVLAEPRLTLPHPAIASRPFVLEPLLEVWPDAVNPATGAAWADLPRAPGPRPHPVGRMAAAWVAPKRRLVSL